MKVRKSSDRGYAHQGWLESFHSFSYTGYYDPDHINYSVLRVINEDVIEPEQGFAMHPHKNMEIITYMLQGELRHEDSLGNVAVVKAGDVQCMTSGTGIVHSEMNVSTDTPAHLLQIWIFPESKSLEPRHAISHFADSKKQNRWCLIVSNDGHDNSLKIHQNILLFSSLLDADKALEYLMAEGRSAYIQIARGEIEVCGQRLATGDALMVDGSKALNIQAIVNSEILLFDLPIHLSDYKSL